MIQGGAGSPYLPQLYRGDSTQVSHANSADFAGAAVAYFKLKPN